jgi:hypothetical protein
VDGRSRTGATDEQRADVLELLDAWIGLRADIARYAAGSAAARSAAEWRTCVQQGERLQVRLSAFLDWTWQVLAANEAR